LGVGGSGWRRKDGVWGGLPWTWRWSGSRWVETKKISWCGVDWHGYGDGAGVVGLRRRNKVGVWGGLAWTWRWSGSRWVETEKKRHEIEKKSWSVGWIGMDMETKQE
jgi:hypothetical protein